jgi:lycopene beta-cyclase
MGAPKAPIIFYMTKHFQYIIVGAGCAGLQLAKALLELPRNLVSSILLLDANQQHDEKSWCFWNDTNHPYRHLVQKEWQKIEFIADDIAIEQSIQPKSYQYINSLEFYNNHINCFEKDDRISIVYDTVNSINSQNAQPIIITSQGNFSCDYVFYTNPLLGNSTYKAPTTWQHFLGWIIETEHPIFDTNKARMMDFSVDNTKDVQFVYVLPFANNKALVECTIFSNTIKQDEAYEATLVNYLQTFLSSSYNIVSKEKGKIPMQLFQPPTIQHPNIIPIGTAAGCIKPSTGYSFARVMLHTQEIITAIQTKQTFTPRTFKPRFVFYDRLFLHIIQHTPWKMKRIFTKLFKYNPTNTILHFLDEKTTLYQDIRIFTSLPKWPFLKALIKK